MSEELYEMGECMMSNMGYMLEELRSEVALYREGTGDLNEFLDIVDIIIAKYSEA